MTGDGWTNTFFVWGSYLRHAKNGQASVNRPYGENDELMRYRKNWRVCLYSGRMRGRTAVRPYRWIVGYIGKSRITRGCNPLFRLGRHCPWTGMQCLYGCAAYIKKGGILFPPCYIELYKKKERALFCLPHPQEKVPLYLSGYFFII